MPSRPILRKILSSIASILIGALFVPSLGCAAKEDPAITVLRQQLVQAQAELKAAAKARADNQASTQASIARLAAADSNAAQILALKKQLAAASEANLAATRTSNADNKAALAKQAADAKQAQDAAVTANDTAQAQLDAALRAAALLATANATARWGTYTTLIVQSFGFLTLIAGFLWQWISAHNRNTIAVRTAKTADGKLDQIHTLVNSNLTERMANELEVRKANLVLLLEMVDAKKKTGESATVDALTAIKDSRLKIAELTAQLADRAQKTNFAADRLAASEGRAGR
jgi:hypothetical protein